MGIEIPGELQWVADHVLGANWPDGDETAMRRLGDLWEQAGKEIGAAAKDGGVAAKAGLAGMKGPSAQAFQQTWTGLTDGDEAGFPKLVQLCSDVAEACRKHATSIEYAKLSVIAALILLAIQIAWLVASAVATFGSSTSGIPIAMAATRITLTQIFEMFLKEIALNVGVNLAVDAGIQGYQMATGNRADWDGKATLKAGQAGFFAGLAGGAVGSLGKGASMSAAGAGAGKFAAKPAGEAAENAGRNSRWVSRTIDALIGENSTGFGAAARKGATAGAISGALGNAGNEGYEQARAGEFKPGELLTSAETGAAGGAVGGVPAGLTTRHGGLVEAYHQNGPRGQAAEGAEFRLGEGAPTHRQYELGGGVNSTRAQNWEYSPPNNGNTEDEKYFD